MLTLFNSESLMEQGKVLRRKSSRLVFEQVKDDTSSLLLLRDRDSFISRQSSAVDSVDFVDTEFGFDRELFSSKAYRSVARSWMRQSILRKRNDKSSTVITASLNVDTQENDILDTAHVADDERIEIMVDTTLVLSYSNLPKIPENASETNKGPTTKTTPTSKTHERRPSRLLAYPRLGRRIVSPPSVQPTETASMPKPPKPPNFLLAGCSASGKSTAMKAIHLATGRFDEYPTPTRLEVIERLVGMIEENITDRELEMTFNWPWIDQLRGRCESVREQLQMARYQSASAQQKEAFRSQMEELWNEVKATGLLHRLPDSVLDKGHS
jgi:hypothetical protein